MAIAIVLKPGHLPTFPRYFLAGYFLAGYFLAGPDAGGVLDFLFGVGVLVLLVLP